MHQEFGVAWLGVLVQFLLSLQSCSVLPGAVKFTPNMVHPPHRPHPRRWQEASVSLHRAALVPSWHNSCSLLSEWSRKPIVSPRSHTVTSEISYWPHMFFFLEEDSRRVWISGSEDHWGSSGELDTTRGVSPLFRAED